MDEDSDFIGQQATRALQESPENIRAAHAVLEQCGAYNLLKAVPAETPFTCPPAVAYADPGAFLLDA